MKEQTLTSKTISIRYPVVMDTEVENLMQLSRQIHGVTPTRNKLLTTAIEIGLPQLINTYHSEVKIEDE